MTLDVPDENPKDEMRREAARMRSLYVPDPDEGEWAAQKFMDMVRPHAGQVIAVYYPVGREMDTLPLVERLVAMDVIIALPKINDRNTVATPTQVGVQNAELDPGLRRDGASGTLSFLAWDGRAPLSPGPYGIPEPGGAPMRPDVIVAPLLAFDRRGTRLGTGGGYYDRSLAILRENGHKPLYIGWAYAQQMCLFPLPCDDHDIPMDMVITPQATHDFRG